MERFACSIFFYNSISTCYFNQGSLNLAVWKLKMGEQVCFDGLGIADHEAVLTRKEYFPPFTANVSLQIDSIIRGKGALSLTQEQEMEKEKGINFCSGKNAERKREEMKQEENEEEMERGKLAYGKMIKLLHKASNQRLHSHPQKYVTGSKQQQITCYPNEDDNDWFILKREHAAYPKRGVVMSGETVRLTHKMSSKNVHSSDEFKSPTSEQQEVCCFGEKGEGNEGDNWKIISASGQKEFIPKSEVLIFHVKGNCYLHSHDVSFQIDPQQPHYGKHQEVTCFPEKDDPNNVWVIDKISENAL